MSEPLFSLDYTRGIQDRTVSFGFHPQLEPALEERGLALGPAEDRIRAEGRVGHLLDVPTDVKNLRPSLADPQSRNP